MKSLLLFFALALLFLSCSPTINGDVSFTLLGSSGKSYKQFISDLRSALPVNSRKVYNIPVLLSSIAESNRYIRVHLTNYNSESITLAVDVLNIYVVAYSYGSRAYYFKGEPASAISKLFPNTDLRELGYTGNYINLETAAKTLRENVNLGFSALNSAITTLYYYDTVSVPLAFLVIIQMIPEAARYKYIEQKVSRSVSTDFLPDQGFISLENKWSALSQEIQIAQRLDGQFSRPVELRSAQGNPVLVTNVSSPVVEGVALLLYHNVNSISNTNTDNDHDTHTTPFMVPAGLIRRFMNAINGGGFIH